MSYIDTKYLNFISPQLQMFKKKGDNLWNFRCPYCGDSQKSKTKARGFVFRKKNEVLNPLKICLRNTPQDALLKKEGYHLNRSQTCTYASHFLNSRIL